MSATPATRNEGGCKVVPRLPVRKLCVKLLCVKLWYVKFLCVKLWYVLLCVKLLYVKFVCVWSYGMWEMGCDKVVYVWVCVCVWHVWRWRRDAGGGGGGGADPGYRIKNKNPTQSCGEQHDGYEIWLYIGHRRYSAKNSLINCVSSYFT